MSFEDLLKRNQFERKMNPLDLVLINSELVYPSPEKQLSFELDGCSFNHVGILINSDILPEYCPDKDKLYVIESTFNSDLWPKGFRVLSWNHLCRDSIGLRQYGLKSNPWVNSFFSQRVKIKEILRSILTPEINPNIPGWWNPFFSLYQLFQGIYNKWFPVQSKKTIASCVIVNIYNSLGIISTGDFNQITISDITEATKESTKENK